jgi:hypothetical protein
LAVSRCGSLLKERRSAPAPGAPIGRTLGLGCLTSAEAVPHGADGRSRIARELLNEDV